MLSIRWGKLITATDHLSISIYRTRHNMDVTLFCIANSIIFRMLLARLRLQRMDLREVIFSYAQHMFPNIDYGAELETSN